MIEMVVRVTDQGATYGVTFVDLRNKCAFNGSDLGKEYSANGLEKRCGLLREAHKGSVDQKIQLDEEQKQSASDTAWHGGILDRRGNQTHGKSLFEILLQPVQQNEEVPYELSQQYKKKKKRGPRPSF